MTCARYATYLGVANAMDDGCHHGKDKDKIEQQARVLVSSVDSSRMKGPWRRFLSEGGAAGRKEATCPAVYMWTYTQSFGGQKQQQKRQTVNKMIYENSCKKSHRRSALRLHSLPQLLTRGRTTRRNWGRCAPIAFDSWPWIDELHDEMVKMIDVRLIAHELCMFTGQSLTVRWLFPEDLIVQ
jgi:hypothetical protein